MKLRMSISKRQKIYLFLFFVIGFLTIETFLWKELLINKIESVHSEYIVNNISDYNKKEVGNITFYNKKDINIEEIITRSQKMIEEVNRNFQQEQNENFNIVIYPNSFEMNSGLRLPAQGKTLGAYYGGNIFLLSPELLNSKDAGLDNIILHEYCHLLLDKRTRGNHPIWFTEGVALYQEYIITGYEWGRDYGYTRPPYLLEELRNQFYKIDDFWAYRFSFLRVRFLTEAYGGEILLKIINELAKGTSYENSLYNILGKNYKDVENQFLLWYDTKIYDKLY